MKYAVFLDKGTPSHIKEYIDEISHYLGNLGITVGEVDTSDPIMLSVARGIASRYYRGWRNLTDSAKWAHAVNMCALRGPNLKEPVNFIICWTEGGEEIGEVGVTIRAAQDFYIPVFNLFHENKAIHDLEFYLNSTLILEG